LALINRGLPGNNTAAGTMMLSLLRSSKILGYAFHGGYEPGVGSDTGLELGVPRTFQYALVPYTGGWSEAGVYRAGLEFNNPLIVRKMEVHPGDLPKRWGFVKISHPNVVISALKPGRDGSAILRVYEAGGKNTSGVKVTFTSAPESVNESNLIEDTGRTLDASAGLLFDLHSYEIKTFKLQFKGTK
jgi:alpha-mannosidase